MPVAGNWREPHKPQVLSKDPAWETRAQITPLVNELIKRRPHGRCGIFAITAARRGDGATFVAKLVARELARKHKMEALVLGLADLSRPAEYSGQSQTYEEISPGVWASSADQPFRPSQLSQETILRRLSELKNWPGGVVLVDCLPPGENAAANSVFSRVDGTVVVVAAGDTTRQDVVRAGTLLKRANAKVIGMILNKRTYAIPQSVRRFL